MNMKEYVEKKWSDLCLEYGQTTYKIEQLQKLKAETKSQMEELSRLNPELMVVEQQILVAEQKRAAEKAAKDLEEEINAKTAQQSGSNGASNKSKTGKREADTKSDSRTA